MPCVGKAVRPEDANKNERETWWYRNDPNHFKLAIPVWHGYDWASDILFIVNVLMPNKEGDQVMMRLFYAFILSLALHVLVNAVVAFVVLWKRIVATRNFINGVALAVFWLISSLHLAMLNLLDSNVLPPPFNSPLDDGLKKFLNWGRFLSNLVIEDLSQLTIQILCLVHIRTASAWVVLSLVCSFVSAGLTCAEFSAFLRWLDNKRRSAAGSSQGRTSSNQYQPNSTQTRL